MAARTKTSATPLYPADAVAVITRNLLKKPPIGGTPIIESIHKAKAIEVIGIILRSPPIFVISFVCVSCSIIPALRNNPALAVECISINNVEAAKARGVPATKPKNMKASWLTVEKLLFS